MITERHTLEEVYEELLKEQEWMRIFLYRNRTKIYRFFLKKSSYPAEVTLEGETPRKNKYILFLECRSKKELSHSIIAHHTIWHYNNGGINVAAFSLDYDDEDEPLNLCIFSPHVFSRYRTRFVADEDIQPKELIKMFFRNNQYVEWRAGVNEKHWEGAIKEGILFAIRDKWEILHVKTFITWDMLFASQEYMKTEMYDSLKDMMDTGIKMPDDLKEIMGGKQTIEDYIRNLKERMKNKKE